ncbi:class I SAM-dependent methyltransferase [Candidatus Borrarchaeum sp.]|uniref:class I SAM-dependent methyltransferase n=1 Tax=Candidatus Borrarchaeum sp. TaxID=2846742 RepID=UPI00258085E9|nr:class I SAM-dependent methyltransferase [Candidatus Borrarchaeum sp.]
MSKDFKKWFDDYSAIYDSFDEHLEEKNKNSKILFNHLNLGQNQKICDVGTGTGNSIIALQKLLNKNKIKGEYVGIDISDKMLKHLRAKSKEIHTICADMKYLPLISDCIDCQTFYFSIHLARNEDFDLTLRETSRVLRNGTGKIVIVTITPNSPFNQLRDHLKGKKRPVITEKFLIEKLKSIDLLVDFTTVVTNALYFKTIDNALDFFEKRGLSIKNREETADILKQYMRVTEEGIEIAVMDQIFIAFKQL